MFHLARKPPKSLPSNEVASIELIKHELELRQKPAIRLLHTHSNCLTAALTSYVHSSPIPRKTHSRPETYIDHLKIYAASVDLKDFHEIIFQLDATAHLAPLLGAKRPPTPIPAQPKSTRLIRSQAHASRIRTARYAVRMLPQYFLSRIPPAFPTSRPASTYSYSLRQIHVYPPSAPPRESHIVHCASLDELNRTLGGYAKGFVGRKVYVKEGREGLVKKECWVQAWETGGWGFDVFAGEEVVTQVKVKWRKGAKVSVEELGEYIKGLRVEEEESYLGRFRLG